MRWLVLALLLMGCRTVTEPDSCADIPHCDGGVGAGVDTTHATGGK